ncbi:MAG: PEP-CTERM sorting domain-containing protein [Planctomycetia bacterium]|nr:PEP-CTERM sorting domain-containing protein [Planctomycetia bacterium]
MRLGGFLPCLGMLLLASPAAAVIITAGDGTGNTIAPPDDPGFANVGMRGSGTVVYLGNKWVLTANHLGLGPVQFGQTVYNPVSGSSRLLTNPPGNGFTANTDLLLYKIDGTPNLPSLSINGAAPAVNWQVTMIGRGRDRNGSEAFFTPNWMPASPPGTYAGYIWSGSNSLRWGTNVISQVGIPQGIQTNSETAFVTRFDSGATPYEAQGAPGDSGGPVFHKDLVTGRWELTGLIFAVTNYPTQPWGTSIFGNTTYAADLSIYRNQILQYVAFPGDLNFDGLVDVSDLQLVALNWLSTESSADANRDGLVDISDIQFLMANWAPLGVGAGTDVDGGAVGVPEPGTVALALFGLASLLALARGNTLRRRSRSMR